METTIPDKAYFRIGEVSRILGVEPYVVRFWESEFRSVRPERTSSAQRVYRRKDVEELLLIRKLLYEEKFTINGAKRQLTRMKKNPGKSADLFAADDRERLAEVKKGLQEIRDRMR
ncbi:MAG: Mercuric resistance operon regulatory protein [Syntrophaceae bacterium PtaU1.Bin231]|nr:MAG: Mercuric resistance operon regulatory protein [Syntrophaceae bacterium PtaU1.Bin231]HOG18297.1 MerR family transcriptional regulator [Syntrophales bacterium]